MVSFLNLGLDTIDRNFVYIGIFLLIVVISVILLKLIDKGD
jgi:hypothetical protein